jgi:serine/threonine protein kinase
MLRGLALATEAIHRCGFLHRDLKPANVMIAADGTAKIADFGLAKRISPSLYQTEGFALAGTPNYSAPEYLFSLADRDKPTVDLYSLGSILYEMLTGRPAFAGASFLDVLQQVKVGQPVRPRTLVPSVPVDLETICLKCMDPSPARRYGSAQLLADDLDRFLHGLPVRARPVSLATTVLR